MKNLSTAIIIILAIAVIFLIYKYHEKCAGKTCFDLPEHGPNWGSKYWNAIHTIADMIPCSICHDDGVELFKFSHDLVNYKLGKKIWDQKNFDTWVQKIIDIKNKEGNDKSGKIND